MAIDALPTAVFKTFAFDGQTAASFGVQVLGEGVFNAPEKSVEFVSIPGRNGDLIIDNGKYENVEVTYPATVIASTPEDFAVGMAAFRNFLCSRKGYCRLEDTYNPNEYRMATYVSGLEVDEEVLRVGKFDIVFNCKPQRYLLDGESAIEVSDGQNVYNSTPFESQPLLAIEGYGALAFNGFEIEIENATMGEILISDSALIPSGAYTRYQYNPEAFTVGDTITLKGLRLHQEAEFTGSETITDAAIQYSTDPEYTYTDATLSATHTSKRAVYDVVFPDVEFNVGTADEIRCGVSCNYTWSTGTGNLYCRLIVLHYVDGRIYLYATVSNGGQNPVKSARAEFQSIIGESTASMLGNPTYIDCDLGEAYMIKNGSYVSLNEYIDLGSDLPTLAPGGNEFDFDDSTMTEVKLTPRWWIL